MEAHLDFMSETKSASPLQQSATALHHALEELEAGLRTLALAPKDSGRVALIVARCKDGLRETPGRARLSMEEGVPGDRWSRGAPPKADMQLAVMRRDVAEMIANGQPLTTFGDNLFVELDISAANLPVGSRLRVGDALVEMTPMPHDGCAKFKSRFGQDALGFVNAKATRDQNLRGIYWKVVEPGEVSVGATIQVLSRA